MGFGGEKVFYNFSNLSFDFIFSYQAMPRDETICYAILQSQSQPGANNSFFFYVFINIYVVQFCCCSFYHNLLFICLWIILYVDAKNKLQIKIAFLFDWAFLYYLNINTNTEWSLWMIKCIWMAEKEKSKYMVDGWLTV